MIHFSSILLIFIFLVYTIIFFLFFFFFFSSRRRHTRFDCDWSSDVCSSDLGRQRAAARTWIEALRIRAAAPEQPVRALSGGNQQKVAIGRLLYQDADVLLLDEPTRGIDIGSRAQLYETIARCADAGKAVLLVSSYLPELFGLCDRLAGLSRRRLSPARPIGQGTPGTVLATAIGEAVPSDRESGGYGKRGE